MFAKNALEELNVQRMAKILDRIKSKKAYVIVPNAIKESVTINIIKAYGPKLPITFTGEEPPFKRTMQAVAHPENFLKDVIQALHVVFPQCNKSVVKLLRSDKGDLEQSIHTDFTPLTTTKPMKHLSAFNYSAIISIEERTQLLCSIQMIAE